MGMGVAASLLRAGHEVCGCDLRAEARGEFAAVGGEAVARPDLLPPDLGALVLLVVNAAEADEALFGPAGAVNGLPPGTLVLGSVTMAPQAARALAARLSALGHLPLDAPVSGGPARAREGALSVMASGSAAAFAAAEPIFSAIAAKVWRLGEEPGVGSTVKMVNQLLAGVHIATAAEALAFGIRAGADPTMLFEVISASAGSSWMWQDRVPHILAGDDAPRSAVGIFVKDLGIVLEEARTLTFPLPLAAAAHQLFLAAAAAGHAGRDDAFVIRVWQALTGIPLPAKE